MNDERVSLKTPDDVLRHVGLGIGLGRVESVTVLVTHNDGTITVLHEPKPIAQMAFERVVFERYVAAVVDSQYNQEK